MAGYVPLSLITPTPTPSATNAAGYVPLEQIVTPTPTPTPTPTASPIYNVRVVPEISEYDNSTERQMADFAVTGTTTYDATIYPDLFEGVYRQSFNGDLNITASNETEANTLTLGFIDGDSCSINYELAITNVQNIYIENDFTDGVTLNLLSDTSLDELHITRSRGDLEVSVADSLNEVSFYKSDDNFNLCLVGSVDSLTLNVGDIKGSDFHLTCGEDSGEITTLAVHSRRAPSTFDEFNSDNPDSQLTSVTFSGCEAISISDGNIESVTTIDASGMSAAFSLGSSDDEIPSRVISFASGSGNDLAWYGCHFNNGTTTVDMGDGCEDQLVLKASYIQEGELVGISGVEVVGIADDISGHVYPGYLYTGFDSYVKKMVLYDEFDGSTTIHFFNPAPSFIPMNSFELDLNGADTCENITLEPVYDTMVDKFTFTNTDESRSNLDDIIANKLETIEFNSDGGGIETGDITVDKNAVGKKLIVKGSGGVEFDGVLRGFDELDGCNSTGVIEMSGGNCNTNGMRVIGGSGDDILFGTREAIDVFTTGMGHDNVYIENSGEVGGEVIYKIVTDMDLGTDATSHDSLYFEMQDITACSGLSVKLVTADGVSRVHGCETPVIHHYSATPIFPAESDYAILVAPGIVDDRSYNSDTSSSCALLSSMGEGGVNEFVFGNAMCSESHRKGIMIAYGTTSGDLNIAICSSDGDSSIYSRDIDVCDNIVRLQGVIESAEDLLKLNTGDIHFYSN